MKKGEISQRKNMSRVQYNKQKIKKYRINKHKKYRINKNKKYRILLGIIHCTLAKSGKVLECATTCISSCLTTTK